MRRKVEHEGYLQDGCKTSSVKRRLNRQCPQSTPKPNRSPVAPAGSNQVDKSFWHFSGIWFSVLSLPFQFSFLQVADYPFNPQSEQTVPENPAFPSVSLYSFAFLRLNRTLYDLHFLSAVVLVISNSGQIKQMKYLTVPLCSANK